MTKASKQKRMSTKCKQAFKILNDNSWNGRIDKGVNISEYGFALLLHFVQIEAAIKLTQYFQKVEDGWPNQLKINAGCEPFRELKASDAKRYEKVIGVGGKSMRDMRNKFAHEGMTWSKKEYYSIAEDAIWALEYLKKRTPSEMDIRPQISKYNKATHKGKKL